MEPFLKEQPDNFSLIGDLGLIHMSLGAKAAALPTSERAMVANPRFLKLCEEKQP